MPENASNPPDSKQIPLEQIIPNPTNPRGFINPDVVDTLAANMAIEGQKTAIKVMPIGMGQYQVVGGDHRLLAAQKLGWKVIRAEVLEITPDQAFLDAYLDNQGQPMNWFADYRAIETLWNQTDRSKGTQKPIATRLMKSEALVSKAIGLMPLLNTSAREAILSLGKNDEDEKVTQKAILALTGLATGGADDQDRVWSTLQVLISHKMTEPQAKALVASIKAGVPAHEHVVAPADPRKGPARSNTSSSLSKELVPPSHVAQPVASAQMESPGTAATPAPTHASKPAHLSQVGSVPSSPAAAQSEMGTGETVFYDTLAGVSIIAKIKTKLKKGEKPTTAETLVLAGHALWTAIHFLGKHGFKLAKWLGKEAWKIGKGSFKVLEKSWIGDFVKLASVVFILWFGVTAYMFGISYPLTAIGTFAVHHLKWKASSSPVEVTPQTQPASASNADSSSNVESAQPNLVARPVVSQQAPVKKAPVAQASSYIPTHAWSDSDSSPQQFEAELAALPNNARISAFPVTPDNTMAGDMAYRRLSDLSNSDKYSMKIGGGTQKVLNVQVSTTNLTINYQNDINSLLGGSLKMDFYWEDVSSAHCDLITPFEANKKPFYQLTVLVNDAKHPLIVQCAKALDMQRLVSALDNYLRAARLQPLALGGMPYPMQGLRLNDKNEVTLLWADSPAGKAGVAVKDILWSFEKNLANPVENKLLQAQLRTLSPGTHALYLVKPADWSKAQIAQSMGQANRFNPKRQMVHLDI